MKIIGVTGGVGAGKSMVLAYLEEQYGARIIRADDLGHQVMEPGEPAYEKILQEFGREILQPDGRIDRKALGDLVFADAEQRARLNGIIHPAVRVRILELLAEVRQNGRAYAAVEAALFLEENYGAFCDETWYIYTGEAERRARLKESRGYTDERVSRMFASQKSHEEFLRGCDAMIDNSGSAQETYRQIDRRMNLR